MSSVSQACLSLDSGLVVDVHISDPEGQTPVLLLSLQSRGRYLGAPRCQALGAQALPVPAWLALEGICQHSSTEARGKRAPGGTGGTREPESWAGKEAGPPEPRRRASVQGKTLSSFTLRSCNPPSSIQLPGPQSGPCPPAWLKATPRVSSVWGRVKFSIHGRCHSGPQQV